MLGSNSSQGDGGAWTSKAAAEAKAKEAELAKKATGSRVGKDGKIITK